MPIPDLDKIVAEVAVKGVIASGGSDVKNIAGVYHFRRTFQGGAWDSSLVAAAFVTQMITPITAALNVAYTGTIVNCRCVNDALDLGVDVTETTAGAIPGDRLSDFTCATLILKSALRGRSYQGQKHYAPMSETDIGDDIFNAGAVTRLTAIKTAYLAGFTDANGNVFVPCVFSRTLSQYKLNPTNVVTADIVQIFVNKTQGTMRKRKAKTVRA